jgi:DNA mismatch repair protein MutL
MTGRYAVAFLFLELPPDQVDVNVHPTKAEVRFRDASALYHLLFAAVRERLRQENLTARLQVPAGNSTPFAVPSTPAIKDSELWAEASRNRPGAEAVPAGTGHASRPPAGPQEPVPPPVPAAPAPPTRPSPEKAIQMHDAYLVLETPEGMLVIDQHALHERILFEELKQRIRSGPIESQRLLIPEPVDLTAEQAARTLEQHEALAELGLGVEDFGGGTVLLTRYPAILGSRSPQTILKAVVDHLMEKERAPSREQLLNDLLSLMACHAAVKAGDPLTAEEISALVARRHLADDTHHCPHGRPTALLFSRQELDRQFRRI